MLQRAVLGQRGETAKVSQNAGLNAFTVRLLGVGQFNREAYGKIGIIYPDLAAAGDLSELIRDTQANPGREFTLLPHVLNQLVAQVFGKLGSIQVETVTVKADPAAGFRSQSLHILGPGQIGHQVLGWGKSRAKIVDLFPFTADGPAVGLVARDAHLDPVAWIAEASASGPQRKLQGVCWQVGMAFNVHRFLATAAADVCQRGSGKGGLHYLGGKTIRAGLLCLLPGALYALVWRACRRGRDLGNC